MEIERVVSDLLASNMYLLREGDAVLVVDPCRNAAVPADAQVELILLTHEHYDHISGVNEWKAATGAPVLCTAACAEAIRDPRRNLARIFPAFCQLQTWLPLQELPETDLAYACEADRTFADTLTLRWRGHTLELFALPGHSGGGMGILADGERFFSGDSLMENSDVELRLPGGSKEQWAAVSLPRLAALPDGITVYPGHFFPFLYQKKAPDQAR